MMQSLFGQSEFPIPSSFNALRKIFLFLLPVIEVSYQIDCSSIWGPFSEDPTARKLMKPIVIVSICKVRQTLLAVICQLRQFPQRMIMTSSYRIFIGFQKRIFFNKTYMLYNFLFFCCSFNCSFRASLLCFHS